MDKILETIMNFINENTTLLIIICIFLIFVLIGYLIDNSIKTKRLEKQMSEEEPTFDNKEVLDEAIEPKVEEVPVEAPVVEEPVVETKAEPEVETPEPTVEPEIEQPVAPVVEEPEVDENENNEIYSNEIDVDPKINDLLLRDFSDNGIETVEPEEEPEVSLNPIDKVDNIEIPETKEESVYKNDKKLSDIFKKKAPVETKTEEPSVNLEKTADFSNELDRILQKLDEVNIDDNIDTSEDSNLEETQNFSNMF